MDNKNIRKPAVLIVGDSGTGKSMSIGIIEEVDNNNVPTGKIVSYGLPPERTLIINPEDQQLPVANAEEFNVINATSWKMIKKILLALVDVKKPRTPEQDAKLDAEFKAKPNKIDLRKIDYVVFDSLTKATEIILKYTMAVYKNFDQYKMHNLMALELLDMLKKIPQQLFIFAIPEVNTDAGDEKRYAKIDGKQLKYGTIEKETIIVLFTKPEYNDDGEMESSSFAYKSTKYTSAKSPPGMFRGKLKNDLLDVANAVIVHYKGTPYVDKRRSSSEQEKVSNSVTNNVQ